MVSPQLLVVSLVSLQLPRVTLQFAYSFLAIPLWFSVFPCSFVRTLEGAYKAKLLIRRAHSSFLGGGLRKSKTYFSKRQCTETHVVLGHVKFKF